MEIRYGIVMFVTTYIRQRVYLKNHKLQVHLGTLMHKCEICDKTFKSSSNLKRHAEKNHLEDTVACNICSKSFQTTKLLADHEKLHNCNFGFSYLSTIEIML